LLSEAGSDKIHTYITDPEEKGMDHENKERKNVKISFTVMLIGILAAFMPFILNADMESYGFAVSFAGLLLAITSFIVFLMFRGRAKVLEGMFYDDMVLAHWTYPEEFRDRIREQDKEDSKIGRTVGYFLGGIFALIGLVFFAADPDENTLFLFILLGIAVFFIIIGYVSAAMERKKAETLIPEAIIAKDGVIYKGVLHTWNAPSIAYLESVSLHPAIPGTILFVIKRLSGTRATLIRYRRTYIAIPIPPGQEVSAEHIVDHFALPMSEYRKERMMETGSEDIQDDTEE
jgi:uncharacterized membrane protein HdeD (DUF308 family)